MMFSALCNRATTVYIIEDARFTLKPENPLNMKNNVQLPICHLGGTIIYQIKKMLCLKLLKNLTGYPTVVYKQDLKFTSASFTKIQLKMHHTHIHRDRIVQKKTQTHTQ